MVMVQVLRARIAGRVSKGLGFFCGEKDAALPPKADFAGELGQDSAAAGSSDWSTMKRFRLASRALSVTSCRKDDVARIYA